MLRRADGIVLRSFPYGEADLIVTFLTQEFGVLKAFAKSPRKIKSRFGSSLEPFTHSKIAVFGKEDAHLPRLTQADIIKPFQGLRENVDCFMKASGMAELALNFLPEGEANAGAFFLLRESLEGMEGGCSPLFILSCRIKFLGLAGFGPGMRLCAVCGGGRHSAAFYMSQGSIVCDGCASRLGLHRERGALIRLSPGALGLYESLLRWELSKLGRIKAPGAMLSELERMLDAHMEYRLSRPLRTKNSFRL